MTGLGDRLNWNLLVRQKLKAFKKPDKSLFYKTIRYTLQPTNKLLVGVANSKNAKPHWIYGGQAFIYIPASPSSTSRFTKRMKVLNQCITLGKLNLIEIPNLGIENYSLELLPPRYFEEFFYEVWWYDGDLVGLSADIAEIKLAVISK